MKAVFLDRDGIINEDQGYTYKIEDFKFVDGILDILKYFQDLGYFLFIVTNQSGLARENYNILEYEKFTNHYIDLLKKHNIEILQVEYCPHHPKFTGYCNCRKPNDGMIKKILHNYPSIKLEKSLIIGDKESDIEAGIKSGLKTILISNKIEHSKAHYHFSNLKIFKKKLFKIL